MHACNSRPRGSKIQVIRLYSLCLLLIVYKAHYSVGSILQHAAAKGVWGDAPRNILILHAQRWNLMAILTKSRIIRFHHGCISYMEDWFHTDLRINLLLCYNIVMLATQQFCNSYDIHE